MKTELCPPRERAGSLSSHFADEQLMHNWSALPPVTAPAWGEMSLLSFICCAEVDGTGRERGCQGLLSCIRWEPHHFPSHFVPRATLPGRCGSCPHWTEGFTEVWTGQWKPRGWWSQGSDFRLFLHGWGWEAHDQDTEWPTACLGAMTENKTAAV